MPATIDVSKDELYLEGREKGREEGEKKGLIEGKLGGLLEGIELALEIKYASEGLKLMDAVRMIGTVEKLEKFKELIKKADGVEVLKGYLGLN